MLAKMMDAVPPSKRGIGMVFQSYAIYFHLNVENNMALALKREGLPKGEITRRIAETALMLARGDLLTRRSSQLSGGSANVWPSAAPSCASRSCSCSTSRYRTWTPNCA